MPTFSVRSLDSGDEDWVRQFIVEHWGSEEIVVHGAIYYPHRLPGFVAVQQGERVGLVTYHVAGEGCEIVSLDSVRPSIGIGTALIRAVMVVARQWGCKRLWVITTNDNLDALRFYQQRGFVLVAVHRNALEAARRLKPEIPLFGLDSIPLRDEIELEMVLNDGT